jgi:hypothetical protein
MNRPPSSVTVELGSIYDTPHSFWVKFQFFMDTWRRCLLLSGIGFIAAIIATIVLLRSSSSSDVGSGSHPCITYRAEDMAESVTLDCFRYLWTNAGCKSTVPDGYKGWYLRSPSAGKTIPCLGPTDMSCGAGSYGVLVNSVYHCDLGYMGR